MSAPKSSKKVPKSKVSDIGSAWQAMANSDWFQKQLFEALLFNVKFEAFMFGKARGRLAWNNLKRRYGIVEHRKSTKKG